MIPGKEELTMKNLQTATQNIHKTRKTNTIQHEIIHVVRTQNFPKNLHF